MERKDCKEEILQSKNEVGGEWRGLRSVNVKKDSRNEKVKKKETKMLKRKSSLYIYVCVCVCVCVCECMREVLDEDVVATCEEMGLWVRRG